ncbi:hypothetical protein HA050_06805 [Iodobacter sp. HSC-16F04]|uniref:Uncharacterized protein n=1 Tax=Iodobacter violaceini TaxID=3044271 RepID=A0ABX0KT02_9NEIS|nr:hypothetical protein [Iodobacter violacea]NHQ85828.1 hypothetical protein [Iodobacter violacea]
MNMPLKWSAVLAFCVMSFSARAEPAAAIAAQFPTYALIGKCSGDDMGIRGESAFAIRDKKARLIRVIWLDGKDKIQLLETMQAKDFYNRDEFDVTRFELNCYGPKKAQEIKKTAMTSEGISAAFKFPKGSGILCYFGPLLTSNCWYFDKRKGALAQAGGWSL